MMKRFIFLLFIIILSFSCATYKDEVRYVKVQDQVSDTLKDTGSKRFLKRKVAIGRFSNETKYAKSFFNTKKDKSIGKQAMDILSAKLASTEKFILLERSDMDVINKELERNKLSALNIPAEYLIIGSISEYGRKVTSDSGVFSRAKKQTAYATVNIRLVEIETGEIIYSDEGSGESSSEAKTVMGVGGRAGYDSTLNDKAVSAAISKIVNNIIEKLLDKPWRSYILDYSDGKYIISGGKSQGIQKNDIFAVYKRGKKVKNPQTKRFIELPGKPVGKIKVTVMAGETLNNEVSYCEKTFGNLPKKGFNNYYIQEIPGIE